MIIRAAEDTVLSTLFERLAIGYNTLGMKHLKDIYVYIYIYI